MRTSEKMIFILIIILIVILMLFEFWVFMTYKDTPVSDIPGWVIWFWG